MSVLPTTTQHMPAIQPDTKKQKKRQKRSKPTIKRFVLDRETIEAIHFDRVKGIAGG